MAGTHARNKPHPARIAADLLRGPRRPAGRAGRAGHLVLDFKSTALRLIRKMKSCAIMVKIGLISGS